MKTFYFKSLIFAGVMVAAQSGHYLSRGGDRRFLPSNVKNHHAILGQRPDVVVFGDSVNSSINGEDQDKSPISGMVSRMAPGYKTASLDHGAYTVEMYRAHFKNMVANGHRPQWIVVPVNLRSFSPGWRYMPEWQFVKERLLLNYDFFLFRAFFRPLAILKAFRLDPITQKEYLNLPVSDEGREVGTIMEFTGPSFDKFSTEKLRKKFILNYMYVLSPDDARIRDMREIARLARKKGVKAFFYITPVDYQSGNRSVGPRFTERIKANSAVVMKALREEGVEARDFSLALPADGFNWLSDIYPNEHLREKGRLLIAREISTAIQPK